MNSWDHLAITSLLLLTTLKLALPRPGGSGGNAHPPLAGVALGAAGAAAPASESRAARDTRTFRRAAARPPGQAEGALQK